MPSRLIVGGAIVLALASALHSGRHVWQRIKGDREVFSGLSATARLQAPATALQIYGYTFDWYAAHLARGDRFYLQIDAEHDPGTVRELASYYLLPAVEVQTPTQATVILSYYTDPSALGLHFITQSQAGAQPIFVSRRGAP